MDKHEAARIFEDIAVLLELQGENPFKVRAYHNAVRTLEDLDEELDVIVKEGRLEELPGIGEGIAEKLTLLVKKGRLPFYEKLKKSVPKGLLELMDVPGLGAKKVKLLYEKLKIKNIEELTAACEKKKLSKLSGFGAKTEENILQSLGRLKAYGRRLHWWSVVEIGFPILEQLSKLKDVKRVELAGSFRRKLETVGDLDFLVATANPSSVMNWFTTQSWVGKVLAKGPKKSAIRLKDGMQADLRVIPQDEYPFALIYFTGSKEFNIQLRHRAHEFGYTLNEYGLTSKKKLPKMKTEADVFKALKLAYIPPELREGRGEIEAAAKGQLPKLVEEKEIKGVFHCHTTDSDGHHKLEEMVAEAGKIGMEYIGIADHSKSSFQANGMDEKRLFDQINRIDRLNRSKKFKTYIFAGVECDILTDGRLDFADDILRELDYVVASVHRSFKLDEKKMTARLIKAVENPYTTILGHLTGRLLLKREPYLVNVEKVIDACIANNTIMELNAHPLRLDMDWRLWHRAKEKGLMCCINPDAHSIYDLQYYLAGVNIARKGWLTKEDILNTLPLQKVKKALSLVM